MLTAQLVDEVVAAYSNDTHQQEVVIALEEKQPILLSYLFSENLEVFTQQEREYMLFLLSVVWESVYKVWGDQAEVTEDKLAKAEEHNWDLLKDVKARQFRERLNVFFADQPAEEELLAFVEDAILDDEESPVTGEAREHLFVTLKSMIDALMLPHIAK